MRDVSETDRYVEMDKVVTALLKGETNATRLSKELDIPRVRVMAYISEWREIAANDENIKERARGVITALDKHYDMLIAELWENADAQKLAGEYKGQATSLKMIGDLEAKRQDALQKAGLYDDGGLGDEIVRMQELMEKYKSLMVKVASKSPIVKDMITEGLKEIYGEAPPVPYTKPSEQAETVMGEVTG